jgi:ABC-type lipoprotein export system ATPase subunit
MKSISPNVKPIDEINYTFPQSNYQVVPQVPFRAIITGPSGSGKSVLLVNMILDIYRNVFSRVFI